VNCKYIPVDSNCLIEQNNNRRVTQTIKENTTEKVVSIKKTPVDRYQLDTLQQFPQYRYSFLTHIGKERTSQILLTERM
jgi:hypothetical protein